MKSEKCKIYTARFFLTTDYIDYTDNGKQHSQTCHATTLCRQGGRRYEGATTAPSGYVWIYNGKSIFTKEYRHALKIKNNHEFNELNELNKGTMILSEYEAKRVRNLDRRNCKKLVSVRPLTRWNCCEISRPSKIQVAAWAN